MARAVVISALICSEAHAQSVKSGEKFDGDSSTLEKEPLNVNVDSITYPV
jgi:hypothetical protein